MSKLHTKISCKYGGLCGGCPWIEMPLEEQREKKLAGVKDLFPLDQVKLISVGEQRLRDRVDLTIQRQPSGQMAVGLWSLKTSGEFTLSERQLVDLDACPMMSEALEEWFKEFRQKLPEIELGSVRLRVSPSGEKGVWLDLSNEDIKHLFEERAYLKWLSERAVVEVGQKKKPLYFEKDEFGELKPRLRKEIESREWFQTGDLAGKKYPIFGAIGGFSQSGFKANKMLVEEVLRSCDFVRKEEQVDFWLEAFCGSGNFTYPLANQASKVVAFDNDSIALSGLQEGLNGIGADHVLLKRVDLKSRRQIDDLLNDLPKDGNYGMLADPPRSGLMKLMDFFEDGVLKPKAFVYVSCFTKSLLEDADKLKSLGYRLRSLNLVDQFPHSPHVEWVSLWSRN